MRKLIYGKSIASRVHEFGVRYALDLCMNQDASFYLDTRNLRRWLIDQMSGKLVLNTFAYTGSLGVAAQAGGASRVLHTDLNRHYLNVAKTSYTLNGFPINKKNFQARDFWSQISRLKRAGEQFDCVIIDPPIFSETNKGTIDLSKNTTRLINKIRPLVCHGGNIVAINNALYVSGQSYIKELEVLCIDGYVEIEEIIPVPDDVTGFEHTRIIPPITNPAPFNHSTKIAVLRIRHKH